MSTFAYRASLIRKIEQKAERVDTMRRRASDDDDRMELGYLDGQAEAYGEVLWMLNELENQ